MPARRAYLVGNPHKDAVHAVFEDLKNWIPRHAELVGAEIGLDPARIVAAKPDRVIVLGGDGTLLCVSGALGDSQLPLIGVNLGKLGYLAEFTADALKACFADAMNNAALITHRMMLDILVNGAGRPNVSERAVNDFVIRDGPPFRMIELDVSIDGEHLTEISGDGLIIATPTGSTAYNMSAGGPLLHPATTGMVLTPICPHALTYRPLVVPATSSIEIVARRVNPGTVVSVDGQRTLPLKADQRLVIRRSAHACQLVRNPTVPAWKTLVTKLKWGARPTAS